MKMRMLGISRVMKNECAEREKGDLVMRPCVKSLGPRGISRVEKTHLTCCEMRNEMLNVKAALKSVYIPLPISIQGPYQRLYAN